MRSVKLQHNRDLQEGKILLLCVNFCYIKFIVYVAKCCIETVNRFCSITKKVLLCGSLTLLDCERKICQLCPNLLATSQKISINFKIFYLIFECVNVYF